MKARLQGIEICNFKAFREFSLHLEGRHLLMYGPNGSGKSSLYWALYTFLQSARKQPKGAIAKYFDAGNLQNLLNIHEDATAKPGKIALTLRNADTKIDTTYSISQTDHDTHNQPAILKGDLASDFITYRFFYGFSDFRNSEKFNVWPLFEKEILPFCVSTGGTVPIESWNKIKSGNPNPQKLIGSAGSNTYWAFDKNTQVFAEMLPGIVGSISAEAQRFYDQHFMMDDTAKVKLKLAVTTLPATTGSNLKNFAFTKPVIEFGIQIDGRRIDKPQAFLNEAKLTQLALSVRFAASLVNLHDSDLKLLVLDDLLVSLDMGNRMKVVDILLSKNFDDYQKIIMTHDLGFFQEFRRIIGDNHSEWCFRSLNGNPEVGINIKNEKGPIEKAIDYMAGHDLNEAAFCLRQAAEQTALQYLEKLEGKRLSDEKFSSLGNKLTKAKNIIYSNIPVALYEKALKNLPVENVEKLISISDDDIDGDTTLDQPAKVDLKERRELLKKYLKKDGWKNIEAARILEKIDHMRERVLNPSAHWNDVNIYAAEIEKAKKLIENLEEIISSI